MIEQSEQMQFTVETILITLLTVIMLLSVISYGATAVDTFVYGGRAIMDGE